MKSTSSRQRIGEPLALKARVVQFYPPRPLIGCKLFSAMFHHFLSATLYPFVEDNASADYLENINLVPANLSLGRLENDLISERDSHYCLADKLKESEGEYDLILLDAPNLGLATWSVLTASEGVISEETLLTGWNYFIQLCAFSGMVLGGRTLRWYSSSLRVY